MLQLAAIVTSTFAALFAYLSWRKSVLIHIYKREEHLRNRLADPPLSFGTKRYEIQVYGIRAKERDSWWYQFRKYSPIGEVEGQTQVTLLFKVGEGASIFENEEYADYLEDIGITKIHSTATKEITGQEEGNTLTLLVDSADPQEVEDILTLYRVALTEFFDSHESP